MQTDKLYRSYFEDSEMNEPYTDCKQHLDDLLALLDLCLAAAASARGLESGLFEADQTGRTPDLTVSADDTDRLLLPRDKESYGIAPEIKRQITLARFHIAMRLEKSAAKDYIPPFEMIRSLFGLDELESFCMLLAFSAEYDRKYEGVYAWLHNNSPDYYPTKWLAFRLYELLFDPLPQDTAAAILTGSSPLCRYLLSHELRRRDRTEISGRLVLSRRAAAYLRGINKTDPALEGICIALRHDEKSYIPFREEISDRLLYLLVRKGFRKKGCFIAELCGEKGIGRTTAILKALSALDMSALKIKLDPLIDMGDEQRNKLLDMIYAETVLTGAVPCFETEQRSEVPESEDGPVIDTRQAERSYTAGRIASQYPMVFWLSPEKDSALNGIDAEALTTELPMLTANERSLFWKSFISADEKTVMSCANRYILTPAGIKSSAGLARVLAGSENSPLSDRHLAEAVRQNNVNRLGGYAKRINAVFTWDDLVVGDEQKRRMRMICDQVRYRNVVNEDWGFAKGSPYGRGLCALFYGSPGTGKTMAAQVMANELGLELYRIDLSQLTSKYIGETQKNVSRLFDRAKNLNAMLFFDEADAMFAKRSEVKDSHDRYANADTAFLLQRLEDYEGITVLATNYVNNIDDAFKRRIRFMINFVFPDPAVRLRLWKKILPAQARTDEPLDLEFFAERFELSGSNIKEILTNAAYLAAAQGTGIKNRHIIEAVKLNFSKYGKTLTNADFGYLGQEGG